jgi:hypothetical protein
MVDYNGEQVVRSKSFIARHPCPCPGRPGRTKTCCVALARTVHGREAVIPEEAASLDARERGTEKAWRERKTTARLCLPRVAGIAEWSRS